MSHSFSPGHAPVAPANQFYPPQGDPVWHTMPREAYQETLPETEWRVDHGQRGSVYVELGGSESAVLPEKPYAETSDWERNTKQELLGVVTAGEEKLALVGVSELSRKPNQPEPKRQVVVVRMDPGKGRGSQFGAEVVGVVGEESGSLTVGRRLLNTLGFKEPSDQMSKDHFIVEQRTVQNRDRVIITDAGSSNRTRVSVANAADYSGRQLEQVWGDVQNWGLGGEAAREMRPGKLRPLPAESEEDIQRTPQGIRLDAEQGHVRFETRLDDRWPVHSRRITRLHSGLDASMAAIVRLGQDKEGSETLYVLDRGNIPYGEEWSLFEGGPLLSHSQRRVIINEGFLAAAQRAQQEGNPRLLRDFVSKYGGMVVLDETQSGSIQLGRDNWDWHFGREFSDQVTRTRTVSGRHAELRFTGGIGNNLTVTDLRSTNGTDIYVGQRKPVAQGQAVGSAMLRA